MSSTPKSTPASTTTPDAQASTTTTTTVVADSKAVATPKPTTPKPTKKRGRSEDQEAPIPKRTVAVKIDEKCLQAFQARREFVDVVYGKMLSDRKETARSGLDCTVESFTWHLLHQSAISWVNQSGEPRGGLRSWLMEHLVNMWEEFHDLGLVFAFGDWPVDTTEFHQANLTLLDAGLLKERLF